MVTKERMLIIDIVQIEKTFVKLFTRMFHNDEHLSPLLLIPASSSINVLKQKMRTIRQQLATRAWFPVTLQAIRDSNNKHNWREFNKAIRSINSFMVNKSLNPEKF